MDFDALAARFELAWLPLVGLAIDIGLLAAAGAWLSRRGHPFGATIGPLLALLVIVLLFATADWLKNGERASFWSMGNLRTSAVQTSTIAVAALGMTVIIIAGGIDLSVGTALSLAATVLAWVMTKQWGTAAAITACLATGCLAGLINGLLTSLLKVVPFIITLGTMTAYLGLGKMLAGETTVRPPRMRHSRLAAVVGHAAAQAALAVGAVGAKLRLGRLARAGAGDLAGGAIAPDGFWPARVCHRVEPARGPALRNQRRLDQSAGLCLGRPVHRHCRHVSVHAAERGKPHIGLGYGIENHCGRGDRRRQLVGRAWIGGRHADRRGDHAGHQQRLDGARICAMRSKTSSSAPSSSEPSRSINSAPGAGARLIACCLPGRTASTDAKREARARDAGRKTLAGTCADARVASD